MTDSRVEIVSQEVAYDGFFRIDRYRLRHRLFDGSWSAEITREVFERGRAAAVLPYDPRRDQVILCEQFRIGALHAPGGPWLLEIVAGIIPAGESPTEVVRREAIEESGCPVDALVPICEYFVSPGGTSERLSLFCGRVDASRAGGTHGLEEEHEDIRVVVMSAEEAIAQAQGGNIQAAAPIIALQWLHIHRDQLRRRWGATPT
jgi:ADP-ribose pyrophosphatase